MKARREDTVYVSFGDVRGIPSEKGSHQFQHWLLPAASVAEARAKGQMVSRPGTPVCRVCGDRIGKEFPKVIAFFSCGYGDRRKAYLHVHECLPLGQEAPNTLTHREMEHDHNELFGYYSLAEELLGSLTSFETVSPGGPAKSGGGEITDSSRKGQIDTEEIQEIFSDGLDHFIGEDHYEYKVSGDGSFRRRPYEGTPGGMVRRNCRGCGRLLVIRRGRQRFVRAPYIWAGKAFCNSCVEVREQQDDVGPPWEEIK